MKYNLAIAALLGLINTTEAIKLRYDEDPLGTTQPEMDDDGEKIEKDEIKKSPLAQESMSIKEPVARSSE